LSFESGGVKVTKKSKSRQLIHKKNIDGFYKKFVYGIVRHNPQCKNKTQCNGCGISDETASNYAELLERGKINESKEAYKGLVNIIPELDQHNSGIKFANAEMLPFTKWQPIKRGREKLIALIQAVSALKELGLQAEIYKEMTRRKLQNESDDKIAREMQKLYNIM
jgi:hypothetical protein